MQVSCDIILNALFILLSATIVLLQLIPILPSWLRVVPFYRKVEHARDKMFRLEHEDEFSDPISDRKVKLKVGYVNKGDKGFNELKSIIKEHHLIPDKVDRIGFAYGDIPVPMGTGLKVTPNYMLFVSLQGGFIPIIYNPSKVEPSEIGRLLLNWARGILAPEQVARIGQMAEAKRTEFLWNLRFALLNIGVGFGPIDLPLESIELSTGIYFDGLTRDSFMHRLFLVRRSWVLINWMLNRELSEPPRQMGFKPFG